MPDPTTPDSAANATQADKNAQGVEPKTPQAQGTEPKKPEGTPQSGGDPKPKEEEKITVSQSQWNQMYARTKKSEEALAKYEKEKADIEEKKLLDEKKYDEVISSYKEKLVEAEAKAERVETMEGTLQKFVDSQIANIPEDKRGLIPENFSAQEKLDYISQNQAFLSSAPTQQPAGGTLPKSNSELPLEEEDKLKSRRSELFEKRKTHGVLTVGEQKEIKEITRKLSNLAKE